MPAITITKPFKYAFRGVEVVEFGVGEQDVPGEVAEIAVREGWAVSVSEKTCTPAGSKAKKTPHENKKARHERDA